MHLNEHEAARWLDYQSLCSLRWLPADEQLLPLLSGELLGVEPSLAVYIEGNVIPRYSSFDKAHQEDHARAVVCRALDMATYYPVEREILYAAAACHDLGLVIDRKTHHLESGRIIRATEALQQWFTREEIELIAQAAEDHRASSDREPRSLYGKIVAEADRLIIPGQIIRRTVQFGLANYPELDKEGHWQRTLEHLRQKYYYGGYLKLWIPESPNSQKLEELRHIIQDQDALRRIFESVWEQEK
ncbi:MAG: HD domain-containing protein [Bacteroidales bacterium]|nr:HD domain-containing protein [Bacteroidales bacterium]MBQ9475058.1 HD domain-containing protein [Bacteroidales bacterium]